MIELAPSKAGQHSRWLWPWVWHLQTAETDGEKRRIRMSTSKRKGEGWKQNNLLNGQEIHQETKLWLKWSFISFQTGLAAIGLYYLCQGFFLVWRWNLGGAKWEWFHIMVQVHKSFSQSSPLLFLSANKLGSKKEKSVIQSETLTWFIFLQYSFSIVLIQLKTSATERGGRPSFSHQQLSPPTLIHLSSPGTPMESRLPFRLDKGAGEEESYMCRGLEAIKPKGNGVEDEEEWSGGWNR